MSVNTGRDTPGGDNTETPPGKEKLLKKTKFCMTFNNYTKEDYEDIYIWSKTNCKKFIIGKEVGESGTKHLQIYMEVNKRMRITEFKNIKCLYKCHIEVAKGSEEDNIKYCSKDGDFIHSDNVYIEEKLDIITELKDWQKELLDLLINCKSKRYIYWIYEHKGGCGKSEFVKYLIYNYNALLCGGGKKADVINIIFNNKSYMTKTGLKLILFDIPRCNHGCISWNAIEEIKNGIIINTKFETGTFICNNPTICIFSNDEPDYSKLSNDRWRVYFIENNKLKFINKE